MNEGLYFFAGAIVTLAVVGTGVLLRGPSEEQRRREAQRSKRPSTPPPVLGPRGGAGDSGAYRPRGIVRPASPPPRIKHGGIGNPAYRKGKR
ncbi:hypothetical protein HOT31_gp050 [Microbacterium phage Hendrix]|uniref:Uncharacterized protein n=1 Tax=Microbacterium phage Hendrix TaxID=2182341 RepID=A0A2U8UU59_9CAUD|nr:hypothetical protein HOT31_gp050 [Microbacterium phage Hendrix]AWN07721.1 hypothetical protein PBI_HENDRIX_50 [Microbacterium phage Hendrix]